MSTVAFLCHCVSPCRHILVFLLCAMPFFSIILRVTMLSCFCHLMSTVAFICHSMCHRAVYFGFLIMCNAVFPYHSLRHHAFMFLSPYYEHCRFSLSLYVSPCRHILVFLLCAMPFFSIILRVTMLSCFCHLIMSTVVFPYHSLCHHAFMFLSPYYEHCRFYLSLYVSPCCIFWFHYYVQCRFPLSFSASPCFHVFVTLL